MSPHRVKYAGAFAIKLRLTPTQVRAAAEQRWLDARALASSPTRRYTGTVYLCGIALDCLLKASLLEKHGRLASRSRETLSRDDQRIWDLIYRSHDLSEILARLPNVEDRIRHNNPATGERLVTALKSLCTRWTTHLRYSPTPLLKQDADDFLQKLSEVKKWLS